MGVQDRSARYRRCSSLRGDRMAAGYPAAGLPEPHEPDQLARTGEYDSTLAAFSRPIGRGTASVACSEAVTDEPDVSPAGERQPVAEPFDAPGDPQTPGAAARSVSGAVPPQCPTRTREYRAGELIDEGFPAEMISDRLDDHPESVVWLDLYDPTRADLQIVIDEFGLHPLAVEDAISAHQRAKVDRYRTHLFANMYAVALTDVGGSFTVAEVSMFVTPRALITVRKEEFDIDALIARWDLNTDLVHEANPVSTLVYGLV